MSLNADHDFHGRNFFLPGNFELQLHIFWSWGAVKIWGRTRNSIATATNSNVNYDCNIDHLMLFIYFVIHRYYYSTKYFHLIIHMNLCSHLVSIFFFFSIHIVRDKQYNESHRNIIYYNTFSIYLYYPSNSWYFFFHFFSIFLSANRPSVVLAIIIFFNQLQQITVCDDIHLNKFQVIIFVCFNSIRKYAQWDPNHIRILKIFKE